MLRRGRERVARVVKIGPAHPMHVEWQAYVRHIAPRLTELLAGIEATTPGARDPGQALPGESDAVVYNHVRQHAAAEHVVTLEDVVARACTAESDTAADRAADLIGTLFDKARPVFYDSARPSDDATSLDSLTPALGPDLVVEIDRAGAGSASLGPPAGAAGVRFPRQLVDAGLRADPPAGFAPGTVIVVNNLAPRPGDPLGGQRDGARVAIRVRAGSEQYVDLAALAGGREFTVSGPIVGLRAAEARRRIAAALGPDATEPLLSGLFGLLPQVVREQLPGRVYSLVHGDLNGGNVLVANGRPYLIDYAMTEPDRPLLTDFAWLEINLLRRAIGARLTMAELLTLQRTLALATLCLDSAGDADATVARLGPSSPRLRPAFRILARLRREALRSWPPGATPFAPEYHRFLLLAAHRTFKWPDAMQTAASWRASVAAGAVAAEWLGDRPLEPWDREQAGETLSAALRLITAPERSAPLVALAAMEAGRPADALGPATAALAGALLARFPPVRPPDGPLIRLGGRAAAPEEPVPDAVTFLADRPAVLLVGESGSGKSTTLRALCGHLAATGRRIPVLLNAAAMIGPAPRSPADVIADHTGVSFSGTLLTAGAVHLAVDGWHELGAADRRSAGAWLAELRRRHPRTAVVVGLRPSDLPGPAGFETLMLAEPRLEQAVAYLVTAAAQRETTVERAAQLARELVDGPGDRPVRDLVRTPLFLSLLGRRLPAAAVPANVADLLRDHFAAIGLDPDEERYAVAVAAASVDAVDPGSYLPAELAARDAALRTRLADAAVLTPELAFTFPVYRDYFAALSLADGTVPPADRAIQVRWQEPLRLYASMAANGEPAVAALDGLDPVAVARVLATARDADRRRDAFVAEMEATLRSAAAGAVEQARAVDALSALGGPGSRALAAVAADPLAGASARIACLIAPRRLDHLGRSGRARWIAALHRALTGDGTPAEVRAAALLAAAGAAELVLLAAAALTGDTDWRVVAAAHRTLTRGRALLTAEQQRAYTDAVARRLTAVESELTTTAVARAAEGLQAERLDLLARLPAPQLLGALLERRFAVDIDDVVRGRLDELRGSAPPAEPALRAAWQALTGPDPVSPDVVTGDDRLLAAAAAHRLLDGAPQDVARLLAALPAVGDRDLPLFGATLRRVAEIRPEAWPGGAIRYAAARAEAMDLAERLAVAAEAVRPREGVAALTRAVSAADPLRGLRLAERLHRSLIDLGDESRFAWPWSTTMAWSRAAVPDWLPLLGGTAADRSLAVTYLASAGFHLSGARPRDLPWITNEVRSRLLELGPEPGITWPYADFIRAAATACLWDVLPTVVGLLGPVTTGEAARPGTSGGSGRHETTARAEMLTAAGYLARRYADTHGRAPIVEAVHRTIRDFRPDHPSELRARLIGLAYLGSYGELLDGLASDPLLLPAARNALCSWPAGPYTPPELAGQPAVAARITARLASPGLPAEARSALLELQFALAAAAGVLARVRDPRAAPG
ncbi:hypothetical protein [Dactylosporangium sp. CA-092794]|uniref:hypothetical protein n=1 Tax=Dactylosporangium sp. CA-092794 TaxID=3239929 RepID=UPI003D8F8143